MAAIDALPPAMPPTMLAAMGDSTLIGLIAAGSDDAFAALDARYRTRRPRSAGGRGRPARRPDAGAARR
jgi:hypothetical protein